MTLDKIGLLALALAACSQPKAPAPGLRLVRELPRAVEVPKAPGRVTVVRLEEVPAAPLGIGIPFQAHRNWPFVVRMQLERRDGQLPEVTIRTLTPGEYKAFGDKPRALEGPPPGKAIGGCYVGPEPGDWVSCQRFEFFDSKTDAALIAIEGRNPGVRRLEVVESELVSAIAPANPLLQSLVRYVPQRGKGGVVSWRNGLAALGASKYAFDVAMPARPELRVALGMEPREPLHPARFVARFDGKVVLDEVLRDPHWEDRTVPLPAVAKGRLELEVQGLPGEGEPNAIWGDPRVVSAIKKPSIVLVTLDAVRPDHLQVYGYERDTSPNLLLAAKAGVLFDRATANAPRTWQSAFSFLTGRYPTRAGVRKAGTPLPAEVVTLPEVLSQYGYDTFGGSDLGAFPWSDLGRFDEEQQFVLPHAEHDELLPGAIAEQMREVARRIAKRPTFAWFHLEKAHYPLEPSDPLRYDPGYRGKFERTFVVADRAAYPHADLLNEAERNHVKALYDACIRDDDAMVGVLIRALIENNVSEDTILVISADHGELVGEHNVTAEHSTWYDRVLHVPLIVIWPSQLAPLRVPQRVQLVDLMPTLLSLAGVPIPPGLDGRDLTPLLHGGTLPEAPAFAEIQPFARVMYRGDEKTIAAAKGLFITLLGVTVPVPERALFDVAKDPDERDDLSAKEPERLKANLELMKAEIEREHRDAPGSGEGAVGQAAVQALRQAGYLAGRAGTDEDIK